MAQRSRDSASAKWTAGVLVGILTVVVIVLAWLAYRHVNPSAAEPTPAASASLGTITASPTPTATPTPTPTPEAAPVDLDAQRFLVVTGETSVWRATAGSCTDGTAPLVERSTDNGATFTDVTPTYLGIAQVASLDPFDAAQAEMVAGMGEGCEAQALRTFTGGDFWESYPDVLAGSTYVDFGDPSRVVTPDGAIDAPCAEAWGLRAQSGTVAVICEGGAFTRDGDGWAEISTTGAVVAVAIDGDGVAVASSTPDCVGVLVTSGAGAATCVADAPADGPVALATANGQLRLWAGDLLTTVG